MSRSRTSLETVATVALWCALAAVGGCRAAAAAEQADSRVRPAAAGASCEGGSVVLLTLDGVRWQEVFDGVDARVADTHGLRPAERVSARELMPNLHRLIAHDGTALGAGPDATAMRASGPNFVSLPGYIELLTGRASSGCADNDCARVGTATLFDELAANGCGRAALFSSWSGIGSAASLLAQTALVSAGRYAGEQRDLLEVDARVSAALTAGEGAGPSAGEGDFRPDVHTAEAGLAYLQAAHPRFLFIGLGETDEYGHADDYRAYLNALRSADAVIGRVAREVFRQIAAGRRSTLLITTDHGRADSFAPHGGPYAESSRVWLVAAGSGIATRGIAHSGRARHLADVAPTIRQLLALPSASSFGSGQVLTELLAAQPQTVATAAAVKRWSADDI